MAPAAEEETEEEKAEREAEYGEKAKTLEVLKHLQKMSVNTYIAPYNFALIYAGLGEKDRAFEWLARAVEARSYLLVEYLSTDSRLDNLREGPRFDELRMRTGLPTRKAN